MISFVVAVSKNNVIGNNGVLPWYIPEDLKKFKEITLTKTKTLIMGRKTFESLPKVLPGRKHIVLTNNINYKINNSQVSILYNIDDLKPFINSKEEYFVIGGGKIFSVLMPYVTKIYMTIIHKNFIGDTFFPQYNNKQWKIASSNTDIVDKTFPFKISYLTLKKFN